MSRTECTFEQDWPLFKLGLIEPDKRAEMQQHLDDGCPHCTVAHEEWAELVPLIGLSAPERKPSQHVEARLERRIREPLRATRRFRPSRIAWGLSFAAMLALVAGLAMQRARFADEVAAERQQIALLRDRTARLTTALSRIRKAQPQTPSESPSSPIVRPGLPFSPQRIEKPIVAKSVPQRQPDSLPAASSPAPRVMPDLDEVSARLSEFQRRAELLEQKLRDAEARNAQLQELAANEQKLSDEVARLRSALTQTGDSRAAYDRLLAVVSSGPIQSVELRPIDPAAGKASARAILSSSSGLFLVADRMPALPANKCYQLWLIRKADPSIVSGGIMQLNADGVAVLAAPRLIDASRITGLAITDEPAGGSVSARGHKLLFGALMK